MLAHGGGHGVVCKKCGRCAGQLGIGANNVMRCQSRPRSQVLHKISWGRVRAHERRAGRSAPEARAAEAPGTMLGERRERILLLEGGVGSLATFVIEHQLALGVGGGGWQALHGAVERLGRGQIDDVAYFPTRGRRRVLRDGAHPLKDLQGSVGECGRSGKPASRRCVDVMQEGVQKVRGRWAVERSSRWARLSSREFDLYLSPLP